MKKEHRAWVLQFAHVKARNAFWFGLGIITKEQYLRYDAMLQKALLNKMDYNGFKE